jgi:hypothetical protein
VFTADQTGPGFFDANSPLPTHENSPFSVDGNLMFQVREDLPSGLSGNTMFEPVEGSAFPLIIVFLIRVEPQPTVQSQFISIAPPGPIVAVGAKGPAVTLAPEPVNLPMVFASANSVAFGVAGVTTSAADKTVFPEPMTTVFAQIGSLAGVLPAQLVPVIDAGAHLTTRLVSPVDGLPATNQVAGTGLQVASINDLGHHASTSAAAADLGSTSTSPAPLALDKVDELPRPSGYDLIAGVLPFEPSSLIRAIDRFFEEFDDLGTKDLTPQRSAQLIALSATLTGAITAMELVRRRWSYRKTERDSARVRDPLDRGVRLGFPELPGSWSSRLT